MSTVFSPVEPSTTSVAASTCVPPAVEPIARSTLEGVPTQSLTSSIFPCSRVLVTEHTVDCPSATVISLFPFTVTPFVQLHALAEYPPGPAVSASVYVPASKPAPETTSAAPAAPGPEIEVGPVAERSQADSGEVPPITILLSVNEGALSLFVSVHVFD